MCFPSARGFLLVAAHGPAFGGRSRPALPGCGRRHWPLFLALARRGAEVVSSDFTLEMLKLGPGKFQRRGRGQLIWASVGAYASACRSAAPASTASPSATASATWRTGPGLPGIPAGAAARRAAHHPGIQPAPVRLAAVPVRHLQPAHPAPDRRLDQRLPGRLQLPAGSIRTFPDQPALAAELAAAGFEAIRWSNLTGGIVALHSAEKPGAAGGIMEA